MIEAKGTDPVNKATTGDLPDPILLPDPELKAGARENICGLLVHAKPSHQESVAAALAALPGVEVQQTSDDGRMVVIVEDTEGVWAGDSITQISNIKGVLSSALVYHQSAENMDEAVDEVFDLTAKEVLHITAKGEEIPR